MFTSSQYRLSIGIDNGDIVATEELIKRACDQGLRVFPSLRLYKSKAALKARREVSTDMHLAFPAWCLCAAFCGFLNKGGR